VRTRGLRGRLILAVLAVVFVGMALLVVGFNLVLRAQLDSDVNQVLRARAAAQVGTLETVDGHLAILDAPDEATAESQVWIFAGKTVLEHPRTVHPRVDAAAAALAGGPQRYADLATPPVRVLAQPVNRAGRRLGTVVVAASRTPYERTQDTALTASLVLAGVLIVAIGLIVRWLIGAALRPVARMTADAAEWSEHDLDRRFSLGPPADELTRLAATLDALLDRLAAAMRREQRVSSELSHELRTPLAKISTQAQLLAAAPDLPEGLREEAGGIVRAAEQMREVIEVLMASARLQAEGEGAGRDTADVGQAVRESLDVARPEAAARGVVFEFLPGNGGGQWATVEPRIVERILAPLVENAGRHARTRATMRIARRGQWLEVSVEDDGPGVQTDEEGSIFEPGVRGSAGRSTHDGAGLGLSLARRLARSAGGDVEADASAPGGRFVVRLPAANHGRGS
jgi:signal transduction histidine kinase